MGTDVQWWGLLVTLLLGLPFAIMNLFKFLKERREEQDAEAVKAASPELMVVGVAGGLATSLLEALRGQQAIVSERNAELADLRIKYSDLENRYWSERAKRMELEEQVADLQRWRKGVEGS